MQSISLELGERSPARQVELRLGFVAAVACRAMRFQDWQDSLGKRRGGIVGSRDVLERQQEG